jgi:glycosyltransferase involved in cell wall biosynthesis
MTTNPAQSPLVSVTMPAHNAAQYLAEAMSSVLAQTLQDLELIVVDDGSTDETSRIAQSFSDPRVVYIRFDRNRGVAAARNAAVERARGAYIAVLDADDIAEPQRLEAQVELLRRSGADVCAAEHVVWNVSTGRRKRGKQYHRDQDIKALLTVYSPLCNSTVMARAEVLKSHHYDLAVRHAEDYQLWGRLALAGCKFVASDQALVTYRVHPSQLSNDGRSLSAAFETARLQYVQGLRLGLPDDFIPRQMPWRERLRVAPEFLARLNARVGAISIAASYEIYARFQFRGNGLLTPFTRLERIVAALWARWRARRGATG